MIERAHAATLKPFYCLWSCLGLSCSCLSLSCLVLPCCNVLSCLVVVCDCLVLFCLALSCTVLPCPVLSCLVLWLSCLVLSCFVIVLRCVVMSCFLLPCFLLSYQVIYRFGQKIVKSITSRERHWHCQRIAHFPLQVLPRCARQTSASFKQRTQWRSQLHADQR